MTGAALLGLLGEGEASLREPADHHVFPEPHDHDHGFRARRSGAVDGVAHQRLAIELMKYLGQVTAHPAATSGREDDRRNGERPDVAHDVARAAGVA